MRLFFLLLSCITHGFVFATDDVDLNIYFESDYRPYTFLTGGKIDGINGILIKEACQRANLRCNFLPMPWNRAMASVLKDPKGGLLSAARTSARAPFFRWAGPMVSSTAYYFKLKERTDISIESQDDVLNYTIGVNRNDIYESVLLARGFVIGKNLLQTSSKDDSIRLFLLGRLDLMIGSAFTMQGALDKFGKSLDTVEAVVPLYTPEIKGNYLATNLQVSDSIINALNTAMLEYRQTAEFNALIQRFRPKDLVLPDSIVKF